MSITPKQKEVFHYIREYFEINGSAPTQREIKDHFGLKSFGSVQRYIKYLVDAGYLEADWNARRGLKPIEQEKESMESESDSYEVPLLGKVAAGGPIPAIEYLHEYISVPRKMIKSGQDYFALKVTGESMIEDGILDGDVVICEKRLNASNGQRVIAIINGEATVKRFYKTNNQVELRPANSALKSFFLTDGPLTLAGVVVGLIRLY